MMLGAMSSEFIKPHMKAACDCCCVVSLINCCICSKASPFRGNIFQHAIVVQVPRIYRSSPCDHHGPTYTNTGMSTICLVCCLRATYVMQILP